MAGTKYTIKIDSDTKEIDKSTKKLDTKFSRLSKTAGKVFSVKAALGAAAVIGGVTAAVSGLISVYKIQEQAEIRTRQTLEATGFAAGLTAKELFNMASGLQEVTTFGDEAIIGGQNLLLTFRKIGKETFPRATEVMLDMSTAMGTDLKSSAIQLGKALNDPITGISALNRVGITFTQIQKDQIKAMQLSGDTAGAQSVILAELENQFGGVSRAAAEGTGSLEQTSNLIGDIFEDLGKTSLPIVQKLNEQLKLVAKHWREAFASDDEKKATVELQSLNSELAKTDEEIDKLSKKVAPGIKGFIQGFGVIFAKNDLVAAFERRAELSEKIKALEKQEFEESDAFIKEKRDAAEAIDQAAKDAQIVREKELNLKLAEIRGENKELLTEETELKVEQTMEQNAVELAALEKKLKDEELAKTAAKAKDLSNKGKHDKALELLQKTADKKRIAELKAMQKFEVTVSESKITLANNTANLINAIAGRETKVGFLIAKAAAAASALVSFGKAQAAIPAQTALIPYPANLAAASQMALLNKANLGVSLGTIAAATIQGFQDGGLAADPARRNGDVIPAFLRTDEVVIPPKTSFQDIVAAGRVIGESPGEGTGTDLNITIGFNDNAMDLIETQIQERRAIGTGGI